MLIVGVIENGYYCVIGCDSVDVYEFGYGWFEIVFEYVVCWI